MGLTACVMLAYLAYGWDRHLWDIPLMKLPSMFSMSIRG
jgi:hypothetical protein